MDVAHQWKYMSPAALKEARLWIMECLDSGTISEFDMINILCKRYPIRTDTASRWIGEVRRMRTYEKEAQK